jgi:SAM-dependent methyltransferase
MPDEPYYRADLARVHHEGFGFHADAVAPGILAILEPVRAQGGLVVEVGCGSGLLTRYLVDAGHRVLATDASPAMVELTRQQVEGVVGVEALRLPDDPIPKADAIVSVGHPISYLDDESQLDRVLAAIAAALRPDGILAFDICDLEWGATRREQKPQLWEGDGWLLVTRTSLPQPNIFRRDMTTFLKESATSWRRDDEVHDNILIDTSTVPDRLAPHGVDAEVRRAFGDEENPIGLYAVVGTKRT